MRTATTPLHLALRAPCSSSFDPSLPETRFERVPDVAQRPGCHFLAVNHEHRRALPTSDDEVRSLLTDFLATVLLEDLQKILDLDRLQ